MFAVSNTRKVRKSESDYEYNHHPGIVSILQKVIEIKKEQKFQIAPAKIICDIVVRKKSRKTVNSPDSNAN